MQVLIIDDDKRVLEFLGIVLKSRGYGVLCAEDGERALLLASQNRPDIVVVDLAMPTLSGLEVCSHLRRWYTGPMLVLSGSEDEATIVRALDHGADDYLTKPIRPNEFVAYVQALLRRTSSESVPPECVQVADLVINFARRRVELHERTVRLTRIEFHILSLLAKNVERVVTSEALLDQIWGSQRGDYSRALRVHIGNIRKKIESLSPTKRYLMTEYGVGYRLRSPATSEAANGISDGIVAIDPVSQCGS